jgi:hypothetical protein
MNQFATGSTEKRSTELLTHLNKKKQFENKKCHYFRNNEKVGGANQHLVMHQRNRRSINSAMSAFCGGKPCGQIDSAMTITFDTFEVMQTNSY